ncbi:MAG: O-antigen ligase family protein [Streptosporangiaceae bacterium]
MAVTERRPLLRADSGLVSRIDGGVLACVYVLTLTVVPAQLALSGLPLNLPPSELFGLLLGGLWLVSHMVGPLGMAKGRNPVRTLVLAYVVVQLVTYGKNAGFAGLPADELQSTDRTLLVLFGFLAVALFVCDAVCTLHQVELILKTVVLGASFMALMGAIQFLAGVDLTRHLILPGLRSYSENVTILERSIFRRPAGTAGHPIEYGVVCAFALPFAVHYSLTGARPWPRLPSPWWVTTALLASGVLFSLSRSATLGVAAVGLTLFPQWTWRRRRQILLLTLAFLVVARLAVRGLVGTIVSLFTNFNNDVSIQGRENDYGPMLIEIDRHVWWGRGIGTFLPLKYTWLDNQYLMTLVENGIIGMTVFILLGMSGVYAAFRVRSRVRDPQVRSICVSMIAALAVSGITAATFDLMAYQMISGLTFLIVGLGGAMLRHLGPERDTPAPR